MKRYRKETILIAAQLALFYLFPLTAGPTDMMGLVFLIIIGTFVLALLMGGLSAAKIKWLYPPLISVLFLPTVWIYYNETALVHAQWYLTIAYTGLLIGSGIRCLCIRK